MIESRHTFVGCLASLAQKWQRNTKSSSWMILFHFKHPDCAFRPLQQRPIRHPAQRIKCRPNSLQKLHHCCKSASEVTQYRRRLTLEYKRGSADGGMYAGLIASGFLLHLPLSKYSVIIDFAARDRIFTSFSSAPPAADPLGWPWPYSRRQGSPVRLAVLK